MRVIKCHQCLLKKSVIVIVLLYDEYCGGRTSVLLVVESSVWVRVSYCKKITAPSAHSLRLENPLFTYLWYSFIQSIFQTNHISSSFFFHSPQRKTVYVSGTHLKEEKIALHKQINQVSVKKCSKLFVSRRMCDVKSMKEILWWKGTCPSFFPSVYYVTLPIPTYS